MCWRCVAIFGPLHAPREHEFLWCHNKGVLALELKVDFLGVGESQSVPGLSSQMVTRPGRVF